MQFDDLFQKLLESPAAAPATKPAPTRTPAPARPTPSTPTTPQRPSWFPKPGTKTQPKALKHEEADEDIGPDIGPDIADHDRKVLKRRLEHRRNILK